MRRLLALVCVVGLGCDHPTAPPVRPPNAVDVTMEYCAESAPVWVAYKNEGYDWVQVPLTPFQRTFTFPATPKLTIATARANPSGSAFVHVMNLAATEVQHFRCTRTPAVPVLNAMTGAVRTPEASDLVLLHTGSTSAVAIGAGSFNLLLPAGPFDLAGTLWPDSNSREPLVIIRHDIAAANGGSIPVLDFTGSEARPYFTSSISTRGLASGMVLLASTMFRTARGAAAFIVSQDDSQTGTVAVNSIDASQLSVGDEHHVVIYAYATEDFRQVRYKAHQVHDTTVDFGPKLASWAIETTARPPFLRVSVSLPKQAAYSSLAEAHLHQGAGEAFHAVTVTTTAAFSGGSADWNLDVPEFERLPGFAIRWGLQAGLETFIEVVGSDARFPVHIGNAPQLVGEVIRTAF